LQKLDLQQEIKSKCNQGLIQQRFQNELARATGQNQATQNLANNLQQQAAAAQQGQQAMVGGILGLGGTLGAAAIKGPDKIIG